MRDIRVGDKVKFLNDTDTGVVLREIDKDLVLVVTDEDGFEYPVMRNELLITGEAKKVEEAEEAAKLKLENEARAEANLEAEAKAKAKADAEYELKLKLMAEKLNTEPDNKKKKKDKHGSGIEEVDLHITQIIDDASEMTSGEIVDVQLSRFRTALDGAIKARQKRIIFIHGKGAGKLKHEIQKIIDKEYSRCRYQDASFREYGYGATMILIP